MKNEDGKKDYIRVSILQQRTDRQEELLKNEIDAIKEKSKSEKERLQLEFELKMKEMEA